MADWYFSGNGTEGGDATMPATACSNLLLAESLGVLPNDTILLEYGSVLEVTDTFSPSISNIVMAAYGMQSPALPHLRNTKLSNSLGVIELVDVDNWDISYLKLSGASGAPGQINVGWDNTQAQTDFKFSYLEIDGSSLDSITGKRHCISFNNNHFPVRDDTYKISNIEVSHCEVYNAGYHATTPSDNSDGISTVQCDTSIKIHHNHCHNNYGQGIDIGGGNGIWMYSNNLHGNWNSAFKIKCQSAQSENVYVFGNLMWDNTSVGQLINIKTGWLFNNICINAPGSLSSISISDFAIAKTITSITPGNPTTINVADTSDLYDGQALAFKDVVTASGSQDLDAGGFTYNLTVVDATSFTINFDSSTSTYTVASALVGFRWDGLGNLIDYGLGDMVIGNNYFSGPDSSVSQGCLTWSGMPFSNFLSRYTIGGNYYESLYNTASPRIIDDAFDGSYDIGKNEVQDLAWWNANVATSTEYYNDGNIGRADFQFTDEATGDFTINTSSVLYHGNNPGWFGWGDCPELITYFNDNVPYPDFPCIGSDGVETVKGQLLTSTENLLEDNNMQFILANSFIRYIHMK